MIKNNPMIPKKKNIDLKDLMILEGLGSAKTVKEIAKELNMGHRTATWRIKWMKDKFKCKSMPQLLKKSALLKVAMKA